jgi:hypothetical protein
MKTTKEDFKMFKKECWKWIRFFHLTDFHYDFVHEFIKDNYAQVCGHYGGRKYWITLSTEFEEAEGEEELTIKKKKNIILESAFHEVVECLLYRLRCQCAERKFDAEEVDSEIHAIINRLQHSIFKGNNFE